MSAIPMSESGKAWVRNLVSLSRTQSRLAQEYKREGNVEEHARLRSDSVYHMRNAYSWRDKYYEGESK